MTLEQEIVHQIEKKGPLIGSELQEVVKADPLLLWRTCRTSKSLDVRIVGKRYLRLDRRIEGYARLSPSILREFLTYTAIGLSYEQVALDQKAEEVILHVHEVSKTKLRTASGIVSTLVDRVGEEWLIQEQVCFIIAGDIVFNMAHDVPRPERSTKKLVQGSDMDIVIILDDRFPKKLMIRLDEEIYKEKCNFLMNPYLREEIDYIVKYIDRVKTQMDFVSFKQMVACKIIHEGAFLYGSKELFATVKGMLTNYGVIEELTSMEEKAIRFRENSEKYLLSEKFENLNQENLNLFFPTAESEEFE